MAISCEESDGKEESGGVCCCTINCSDGGLQNPSLNPSRPSPPPCTQHLQQSAAAAHHHAEEEEVEEEEPAHEDNHPKVEGKAHPPADLEDEYPPSPSHLHRKTLAFADTQQTQEDYPPSPSHLPNNTLAFAETQQAHETALRRPPHPAAAAPVEVIIHDAEYPPSPSHLQKLSSCQTHHHDAEYPPSPSHLQKLASSQTQHHEEDDPAADEENNIEENDCNPHEQAQRNRMINMSLLSIQSPPSSRPELRPPPLHSPSPAITSSSQHTDQADTNAKALHRHSQLQEQQVSLLNNASSVPSSNPFSTAANSLDPNAREFIPITPSSSSLSSTALRLLQQNQTQGRHSHTPYQAEMASLHQHMGSQNQEVGKAKSAAYEPVQPNQEMGAALYRMGPAISEVGYHIPCTGEVGFHSSQEGAYENHGYGVYPASSQMGFPVSPLNSSSVPLAMATPPLPLIGAPIAAAPPLPSPPFMCPPAGFMEAQLSSALHIQRPYPPHHGYGCSKEHVSRALLISGIPPHLGEAQLREALECWGPIRAIQADVLPQGLQLTVQYFDLRSARQALRDMQNLYMHHHQQTRELQAAGVNVTHEHHFDEGVAGNGRRGLLCSNVISAQYIAAWAMPVHDAHNQGTLVLFNVGADVNMQDLRRVFEAYGNVREVREAPTKRQHKFVEFYDIRAAAAAWSALNGQEICGKCVKIEFSRQGGAAARRQKAQEKGHQEMIVGAASNNVGVQGHIADPFSWNGDVSSHGLMQGFINGGPHHQGWERWPSQEGFPSQFPVNMCVTNGPNALPMSNVAMLNADVAPKYGCNRLPGDGSGRMGVNEHRYGLPSAPRRGQHVHGFDNESRQIAATQSHCVGASGVNNAKERHGGGSRLLKGHAHYKFDEDEMHSHPSNPRNTLMIQNIPNKYSQKMLLTMLDQHCLQFNSNLGTDEPECAYDFMYLPIDFKNKCNLGYAFVNFTTPQGTLGFYKAFHGKAWEEFNSRKICGVAFARLQGRSALEEHFRNSRFACDTEEYLPVLFVPARNGENLSQPRVAVGQSGIVRGCRTGNGGHSYFADEPCRSPSGSHDKALSDSNSNASSACEAHDLTEEGDAHNLEALDLPPPEMGA